MLQGEQQPRVSVRPPAVGNAVSDVVEVAARFGLELDEWQQNALAVTLGETSTGAWASRQNGICVPRQNGKGSIIEARELAGLLLFGEQMIVHSAHELRTAQQGFQRLKSYFENYDDLRKRVRSIGNAVAREYIRLNKGQEIKFITRTRSAIRGFSLDCCLLDEGQILGAKAWSSILYTVGARPNHQVFLLGTAPSESDDSEVFTRFRQRALRGGDESFAWAEWSAEEGCDPDSQPVWSQANPALGLSRLTLANIRGERAADSEEGFLRERLGIWPTGQGSAVIDHQTWQLLGNPSAEAVGAVAYAVDVAPDRGSASIGMTGVGPDGRRLVEFVESRKSVDWVVGVAARIAQAQRPKCFVVDAGSPAGALVEPLVAAGVPVMSVGAREYANACGRFYDESMSGLLVHLDQPPLNVALAGARKRPIGTEGAWGWHRRSSQTDITPLVAVTLAVAGLSPDAKIKQQRRPASLYAF